MRWEGREPILAEAMLLKSHAHRHDRDTSSDRMEISVESGGLHHDVQVMAPGGCQLCPLVLWSSLSLFRLVWLLAQLTSL